MKNKNIISWHLVVVGFYFNRHSNRRAALNLKAKLKKLSVTFGYPGKL